jgi:phosphate uptake regulator
VQLQYVVVSLLRDATETFVDAADADARIRDRADEARRSAEMVARHFSRSLVSHAELDALGVSRPELFAYHALARRLDTVADQAVRIASTGKRLPEPLSDETTAAVRSVADDVACAVDDAVTAVLNGDKAAVRAARDRCDDAGEGIEAVEQGLYDESVSGSVPEAVALSDTLSHLQRTVNCGRHMADTASRTVLRAENIDT